MTERGAALEGVGIGVGVAQPESLSSLFGVASVSVFVEADAEEAESIDADAMLHCWMAPSTRAASCAPNMMLPRLEKETVFMKASSRRLSQGMDTSMGTKGRSQSDEIVVGSTDVAVLVLFLFEIVEAERDLFQKWEEPCSFSDECVCSSSDPVKAKATAGSVAVALTVEVALAVASGVGTAAATVECALAVGVWVLEALKSPPLLLVLALTEPRHKGCVGENIWENMPKRDPDRGLRPLEIVGGEEEQEFRGDDWIERRVD